jgi:hypothetical protein
MTLITRQIGMPDGVPTPDYRSMPMSDLIHRIAHCGSRDALNEFHEHRKVFRVKDGPPLALVEFVQEVLRTERKIRFFQLSTSALDRAYDLTVDKFFMLPAHHAADSALESGPVARAKVRSGTDCRHYFMAIDKTVRTWRKHHPDADPLTIETACLQIIQRRVAYHCWWSCLEAKRNLHLSWSRFRWELPNGSITVWMPRWMAGLRRQMWLEANVVSPDAVRAGEKERIQAIIDATFRAPEFLSFDEITHTSSNERTTRPAIDLLIEYEVAKEGLAEFVVREKTMRINEQRDSIRTLGKKGLTKLINRIFDELPSGHCEDRQVAAAFGLTKPTYSRFAGSRWKPEDDRDVPDLWLNVAQIISCCPTFRELAKAAGLWKRIELIVQANTNRGPSNA